MGFPCGSAGKESTCSTGDLGSIPGLGGSPGEGKGYPLQYSRLENSMNCVVRGVIKSQIRLCAFHFHMCVCVYIYTHTHIYICMYIYIYMYVCMYICMYEYIYIYLLFHRSVISDSLWPLWTGALQACLSFTISQSLFKLMSIDSVQPSNHPVLCHPLLLLPTAFSLSCSVVSNSLWPHGSQLTRLLGSQDFSRQEYRSGLLPLLQGIFPDPGIKPASPVFPALAGGFFTTESPGI